jgi:hypothetical protein
MPRPDDEFSNPSAQEIADGLMMPTAELGAPLIAAVLLVAGLAVHFGSLGSVHHFSSATNTAHLRAAFRQHDDGLRRTGTNMPSHAG